VKYEDYFDRGYYENPAGTGLGRCNYQWGVREQQQELEMKWAWFTKFCPNPEKEHVLFVGCAKGYEVRYFRDKCVNAVGVDISAYAIEHCDPTVKEYVSQASATDLSRFGDDSFSTVLSFDVLQIIEPGLRDKAVREIERVTKDRLMLRIAIRPWYILDTGKPHTVDGAPVYLDLLSDWVKRVEIGRKFVFKHLTEYQDWMIWVVFERGIYEEISKGWSVVEGVEVWKP